MGDISERLTDLSLCSTHIIALEALICCEWVQTSVYSLKIFRVMLFIHYIVFVFRALDVVLFLTMKH